MPITLKSALSDHPRSISLKPDAFADEYWVLEFRTDNGERVEISLSPRALSELHSKARSVPAGARETGQSETCDLCGEQVDLFLAVPNALGRPIHRQCYTDKYGADWVSEFP